MYGKIVIGAWKKKNLECKYSLQCECECV